MLNLKINFTLDDKVVAGICFTEVGVRVEFLQDMLGKSKGGIRVK